MNAKKPDVGELTGTIKPLEAGSIKGALLSVLAIVAIIASLFGLDIDLETQNVIATQGEVLWTAGAGIAAALAAIAGIWKNLKRTKKIG